jgi:predicted nucleotidyltransferase
MITSEILQKIKQRIVQEFSPKYIFVFGSYARGTQDETSDLDIAVVIDNQDKRVLKEFNRKASMVIWELQLDTSVDLIIMSLEFFNTRKPSPATFAGTIFREGQLLYAA